ncbi:MAG TPA: hypothetical protein VL125_14310 [Pelobium sp.]|nr:hypothetical protein [Pelobium sp.]
MTVIIIIAFIAILITGFAIVYKRFTTNLKNLNFANEFRNKFIDFANDYFRSYDSWSRKGTFNGDKYVWLTMNVNKMQGQLGHLGTMHYVAPFQIYQISNYQILINTIPKFRDGKVQEFDVNSSDDCLLRYLGVIENIVTQNQKSLKNPVIWFKEGMHEVLSLPILILNWFGIFSNRTLAKIMTSSIYKVFTGLTALITLISGIVTIIQGKEKTIELIQKIIGN